MRGGHGPGQPVLLAVQGSGGRIAGGHIAIVVAVNAQCPDLPCLKAQDRLRRRRDDVEYPAPGRRDPLTAGELGEGVSAAEAAANSANRFVDSGAVGVF